MAVVAGIDVGTQSTKVICYDTNTKTIVASAQSSHDLIAKEDGTREQEAQWWVQALISCFASLEPGIKSSIVALGVSAQQHGFVPVDAQQNVLSRVKLWNDTSTMAACEELTALAGGEQSLLANEGNLILCGYTASKILWFKKHHRDLYDRMAYILLPHNYINWYLTGRYTMEYGDASGTALLDIRSRTWSDRLLRSIDSNRDLAASFPPFIGPDEPAGYVRAEAARQLGIREGILVSAGGGDNMMGAIGTGAVSEGILTMSLGTSGTLYGASDTPIIDPQGLVAAFCSSTGSYLPLFCTMNCTVASEVTRSLFHEEVKEFDACAKKAPIGCEGVVMLPYFNGERSPNYPRGKGCLMGFHLLNMTKENICRAAMESAIFGLKIGLDVFTALGYQGRQIRLVGGGAKSSLWRSMAADICELPVVVPRITEAAAFGAALQALWAYEKKSDIHQIVAEHVKIDSDATCEPQADHVRRYRDAYRVYQSYVEAVKPLFSL